MKQFGFLCDTTFHKSTTHSRSCNFSLEVKTTKECLPIYDSEEASKGCSKLQPVVCCCLSFWCTKWVDVMRVLCVSFVPFWCVQTPWDSGCDVWWDEVMRDSPEDCEPEWLDAEDPLFILYTSGSTGKPKVRRRCMKPVLQQKHRGNLQETKKEMLIFSETTSFKSQCLLFYPAKPGMVLNAYFYIICCEIVQIVGFLLLRGNYRKSKAPQLHVTRILCVLCYYYTKQIRWYDISSLSHTHTHLHARLFCEHREPPYVCCLCVHQLSPHSCFYPRVRYRVFSTLLPGICSTHHWPSSMFSIITMTTCTGAPLTSAGSPATPTSPTAPLRTVPQVSWWVWSRLFAL